MDLVVAARADFQDAEDNSNAWTTVGGHHDHDHRGDGPSGLGGPGGSPLKATATFGPAAEDCRAGQQNRPKWPGGNSSSPGRGFGARNRSSRAPAEPKFELCEFDCQ